MKERLKIYWRRWQKTYLLALRVNNEHVVTVISNLSKLREFAVGFLLSEGILNF